MEDLITEIKLVPVNEENRASVLSLSVREDQPFVATSEESLQEGAELNTEYPYHPPIARPFAIMAGDRIVGFTMFSFAPDCESVEDRYILWRFMIDQNEQGKGYGQAALMKIIQYFRDNGADRLYVYTEPENVVGIHVYQKAGFHKTGEILDDGEAELMQML